MKALLATIALLCVSSTVLAHDIYSDLRDRDGNLCCGGQDCGPVKAVVLPNANYYLPQTREIIPAEMATPSPDDRFHRCIYYPPLYEEPKSDHKVCVRPYVCELAMASTNKSLAQINKSQDVLVSYAAF